MNWYLVSKKYIEFLKKYDNKVGNVDYGDNIKPYLGIVLEVNNIKYYVPVSSPKAKHMNMKNNIDFLKIEDEGRLLAIININNMIPVPNICLTQLKYRDIANYRFFKNKNEVMNYVYLLQLEKKWIDNNENRIIDNACKLYNKCLKYPYSSLVSRCCKFKLLEIKCLEWEKTYN